MSRMKIIRDAVMGVVGTHFRPELINRIDDAVVFHALGRDHIRGILDVQLSYLRARLEEMDYGFELTRCRLLKNCVKRATIRSMGHVH